MLAPIKSEDCFLEAHYYSGGLRHFAFPRGARPDWVPDQEAVGFRDEFELNDGDCAIEVRRFSVDGDKITWVGIYFRSIDVKLGDRGNHAGVGAWYRNSLPADFPHLLHGLELLARKIASEPDPEKLVSDADRFSSKEFLPSFAVDSNAIDPSSGYEFGKSGLVETKVVAVHCTSSVSECRTLTDYLVDLTYLEEDPVPPRVLVHVSANSAPNALEADNDLMAKLIRAIPVVRAQVQSRADHAERALEAATAKATALERDLEALQTETSDLQSLRDDPQRGVERRLDEILREIHTLQDRPTVAAIPQSVGQSRRQHPLSPVSHGSKSSPRTAAEPSEDSSILPLILLGAGFIVVVVLLFLLVDWLFPMMMSPWGEG